MAFLGLFVGAVGFALALWQYRIGQKWKKSEFAAKQLEPLTADPRLATCCSLLDWSARRIPVPVAYRELVDETTFVHSTELLADAMVPESEKSSFTWQEVLYRDLFDYFFTYLERINHYINVRLITVADVAPLEYWLREIHRSRFDERRIFDQYLLYYQFDGVVELMEKFAVSDEHNAAT